MKQCPLLRTEVIDEELSEGRTRVGLANKTRKGYWNSECGNILYMIVVKDMVHHDKLLMHLFCVFRVWNFWHFLTCWQYICFVLTSTTAHFAGSSLTIGLCLLSACIAHSIVLYWMTTGVCVCVTTGYLEKADWKKRQGFMPENMQKVQKITKIPEKSLFQKKSNVFWV